MKSSLTFALTLLCGHGLTARAATVQGLVQDANHRPVPGAAVHLQSKSGGQSRNAKTGDTGLYRFDGLAAGTYSVRIEAAGCKDAMAGPFVVTGKEVKQAETTVAPAFFDEPSFVVAGVTTGTYQGGHGSDANLRSTEGLVKATASLGSTGALMGNEAAESHHRRAEAAEKSGNALDAAREYQRAAELEGSERNFFDWGTELLTHQANQPAAEVFAKGGRLFPASVRLKLGLAVASYALGSYDKSAQAFFDACDIDPRNPMPYLFLGKVKSSAVAHVHGFVARFQRFVEVHPENAEAHYLYAAALWAQRKGPEDREAMVKVKPLLKEAIELDPKLASAYLLLGAVETEGNNSGEAIAAFQKAIEGDPESEEAHYRLAQAYRRVGDATRAQNESAIYDRLSKTSADKAQHDRSEMLKFVIALRTQ